MRLWTWRFAITGWLTGVSALSAGGQGAVISGSVRDAGGKPVEHATVLIYRAGVKKGYSTFCPTCYRDCGKRALTDAAGAFTIKGLSPDLWFDLLAVGDGYVPVFVRRIDPAKGPAPAAALAARAPVSDPQRVVRGRLVDAQGNAVADAIVEPRGVLLVRSGRPVPMYGTFDVLAVANAKGEFEIAYTEPLLKMLLSVEGRGLAPRVVPLATGPERQTVTLAEGATVRGRLADRGKPVGGAEIGLVGRGPAGMGGTADFTVIGNPYSEMRIGVQEDGTFSIPNVPAPEEWYVYARMESLAGRGAVAPVPCATRRDGEVVDIGEMQIQQPAYRLRGRIVLRDGKAVADGMRVEIARADLWQDRQTVLLGPGGRFEFAGLPAGRLSLTPSVKDYSLPLGGSSVGISMAGDVNDFVVTLAPASETAADLAALRARLLEGPVLVLALDKEGRFQYEGNLIPTGERGYIVVSLVMTAGWGTLRVEGGALMSWDQKTVTVIAPTDRSRRPLRGAGWELQLKPGWTLGPGARQGDWQITEERPATKPGS